MRRWAERVILMDAADAPSSGASGDSNAILQGAARSGNTRVRSSHPWLDPPAVEGAFAAGVGGTVRTSVGGALDPCRDRPMSVEARVRLLSHGEGRTVAQAVAAPSRAGTAVLQAGNATLVVTSRPVSFHDRSLFGATARTRSASTLFGW